MTEAQPWRIQTENSRSQSEKLIFNASKETEMIAIIAAAAITAVLIALMFNYAVHKRDPYKDAEWYCLEIPIDEDDDDEDGESDCPGLLEDWDE